MLDPATVTTTAISVIDLCPRCEGLVVFEDHDGLLACPHCGYPQDVPHGIRLDEWETLLTSQLEPLDEAGWAYLLAQVDQLDTKEA